MLKRLFLSIIGMGVSLLSDINPAGKSWIVRARVSRMWEYSGVRDDQPPLHLDMVLVDHKVIFLVTF